MFHRDTEKQELYVIQAGETLGPFTRDELARLISEGEIEPQSLVKNGLYGKVFSAMVLQDDQSPIRRSPK